MVPTSIILVAEARQRDFLAESDRQRVAAQAEQSITRRTAVALPSLQSVVAVLPAGVVSVPIARRARAVAATAVAFIASVVLGGDVTVARDGAIGGGGHS